MRETAMLGFPDQVPSILTAAAGETELDENVINTWTQYPSTGRRSDELPAEMFRLDRRT